MELQRQAARLTAEGRGLAVITYDPPEVLARFASAYGISYPLLSDAGSTVIRRYGLLNPAYAPGTRAHGVPYPGTFVLDARGRIVARHFETAYQERTTVGRILSSEGAAGQGPLIAAETAHLAVQAVVSDASVAPGHRFTVTLDVTPARGMHVYAPGRHTYQVIRFQLVDAPWVRVHPMDYPPPEIYHFVPLDERVETYQRPFTLRQDLTVLATPDAQQALAGRSTLPVNGRLEYQACDDRVCYAPAVVPIAFTIGLTPLVRPQ